MVLNVFWETVKALRKELKKTRINFVSDLVATII